MDSTYRGLAFLLSLGTLPIACKPEENTTDSGAGTTSGGTTTDEPTGSGTTTGGSTGSGSDGMTTTSGTGTATGTGTGTTGGTDPTTAGETETGGPAGACQAYAAHSVMCDPSLDLAEEVMLCESDRTEVGQINGEACLALYDEVLACFTMQSCDTDPELACQAEIEAFYNCSPAIGEVCKAYGMKYAECLMEDPDMTAKYCQLSLNEASAMSPMCGTAYEEVFVCMTKLPCADIEMGSGCDAEKMAVEQACGG